MMERGMLRVSVERALFLAGMVVCGGLVGPGRGGRGAGPRRWLREQPWVVNSNGSEKPETACVKRRENFGLNTELCDWRRLPFREEVENIVYLDHDFALLFWKRLNELGVGSGRYFRTPRDRDSTTPNLSNPLRHLSRFRYKGKNTTLTVSTRSISIYSTISKYDPHALS